MNMRTIPMAVLARAQVTGEGPIVVASMCGGKMRAFRRPDEIAAGTAKRLWNREGCGCPSCRNEHYVFRVDGMAVEAAPVVKLALADRIMGVLRREAGQAVTPIKIAEEVGASRAHVCVRLADLEKAGQAAKLGRGQWVIGEEPCGAQTGLRPDVPHHDMMVA